MKLSEIKTRLTERRALPCADCSPDFTCSCCTVDQEMAELIGALREVDDVRRYIREAQSVRVEVSSEEIERRLDGIIGTMFMDGA